MISEVGRREGPGGIAEIDLRVALNMGSKMGGNSHENQWRRRTCRVAAGLALLICCSLMCSSLLFLNVDFLLSLRHRYLRTSSGCPEFVLGISLLGAQGLV